MCQISWGSSNFVLIPILGVVLVMLLPLTTRTVVAVMLLAVAPGSVNSIQFRDKVSGKWASAITLLFLFTLIS